MVSISPKCEFHIYTKQQKKGIVGLHLFIRFILLTMITTQWWLLYQSATHKSPHTKECYVRLIKRTYSTKVCNNSCLSPWQCWSWEALMPWIRPDEWTTPLGLTGTKAGYSFHLIPFGGSLAQMLPPFFWSQFLFIKRKVNMCPNPVASITTLSLELM